MAWATGTAVPGNARGGSRAGSWWKPEQEHDQHMGSDYGERTDGRSSRRGRQPRRQADAQPSRHRATGPHRTDQTTRSPAFLAGPRSGSLRRQSDTGHEPTDSLRDRPVRHAELNRDRMIAPTLGVQQKRTGGKALARRGRNPTPEEPLQARAAPRCELFRFVSALRARPGRKPVGRPDRPRRRESEEKHYPLSLGR